MNKFVLAALLACAALAMTSGLTMDEMIAGSVETADAFDFMDPSGEVFRQELDMMLTKEQYIALNELETRKKRKALRFDRYRWTDKTIPYSIASGIFSQRDKAQIQAAMDEWSALTCIKFRERTRRDDNYVNFNTGNGCYSYIGMIRGQQEIGLANGCRHKGVIVHEIGHAVGFHHEQNRPDRDNHVEIIERNIPGGVLSNFKKYPTSQVNNFEVPYDYSSVMHYGGTAFSTNGGLTIRTKDPRHQSIIGNRQGLSFYDVMLANKMYNCDEGCGSKTCPSGGFLGKDCKCWCKGSPVRECSGDTGVTDRSRATTPRTTRTTPSASCTDGNENCKAWSEARGNNYCQTNTHVKMFCRKSCGSCDGAAVTNTCVDKQRSCTAWKERGLCERSVYKSYLERNCAKACGFCSQTGVNDRGSEGEDNAVEGGEDGDNVSVGGEGGEGGEDPATTTPGGGENSIHGNSPLVMVITVILAVSTRLVTMF